jgi:ornithine cyclodeaminase
LVLDYGKICYLRKDEIKQICKDIDVIAVMREVFKMHAQGQVILPDEAYLSWQNDQNEPARSLNMPGYIGGSLRMAGTKIINGNICNPCRNLPRASGLTLLYDPITARVICIMEASYLSSLRTAGTSALAIDLLRGPAISCVAVIGAGVIAQAHIELLIRHLPEIKRIRLFDIDAQRRTALQRGLASLLQEAQVALEAVSSAEDAIRPAQLIIPATTVTAGYIQFEWLQPGAILVNVSLDDPLPEVVMKASVVVVDDWNVVRNDAKRLLGRMYREGRLLGPDERAERLATSCRRVDAQLGELVIGARKGRQSMEDVILVNPFGLSIEDIALASLVYQKATLCNLGTWLEE